MSETPNGIKTDIEWIKNTLARMESTMGKLFDKCDQMDGSIDDHSIRIAICENNHDTIKDTVKDTAKKAGGWTSAVISGIVYVIGAVAALIFWKVRS